MLGAVRRGSLVARPLGEMRSYINQKPDYRKYLGPVGLLGVLYIAAVI